MELLEIKNAIKLLAKQGKEVSDILSRAHEYMKQNRKDIEKDHRSLVLLYWLVVLVSLVNALVLVNILIGIG